MPGVGLQRCRRVLRFLFIYRCNDVALGVSGVSGESFGLGDEGWNFE